MRGIEGYREVDNVIGNRFEWAQYRKKHRIMQERHIKKYDSAFLQIKNLLESDLVLRSFLLSAAPPLVSLPTHPVKHVQYHGSPVPVLLRISP